MKTVLITGATSGLGLALARLYAPDWRLVLVGRRPLAELHDPLFTPDTYCHCDLARPDCAERVVSWLEDRKIERLELLIHNAGVGFYGGLEAQSLESIDELLAVNLYAPLRLSRALLPLLERARGKIVFISSVAADLSAPDYAVYGATKAALSGFARNLRLELGGRVRVQTLYPGAIRTDMHAKSGVPAGRLAPERFPSAETVARQVLRAAESHRASVTLGAGNRLLRGAGRYFPELFDRLSGGTR